MNLFRSGISLFYLKYAYSTLCKSVPFIKAYLESQTVLLDIYNLQSKFEQAGKAYLKNTSTLF